MLHAQYRWHSAQCNDAAVTELARSLKVSKLLSTLLVSRGWVNEKEAAQFLGGSLNQLHDPYLMHGMAEAVDRIHAAVENGEKILIYGDYDADGVSSTALMINVMKQLNANFDYYIPHRSKEGYGLHNHVLDQFAEGGYSLVVTVDTGVSAVHEIEHATQLGMDVIVTDHHEPPSELPKAYALVNPKLPYCTYPFKGLAGVGVAYKLACALLEEVPDYLVQLVAIGTVADLMPLVDENRYLVREGLRSMSEAALPGIAGLLRISGGSHITSTTIGFGMAPRINASGRLDHASRAVQLLITEQPEEADALATELDLLNRERQQTVDDIVQQALSQLEALTDNIPPIIVLAGEDWNVGVVGIVASKILDRFYRPTIILGINSETGECKGSARSIPGFDMYAALTSCSELMDHYGGHTAAAGMSLQLDRLEEFRSRLEEYASCVLTDEDFVPSLTTDMECTLSDLTLPAIEELSMLEPFGMNNACPRFLIRGARLIDCKVMGKDSRHLKLILQQNGTTIEAVAFGKGELASFFSEQASVDLVAEASINEWNGSRKPQLMVVDVAISHMQVYDYRGIRNPVSMVKEMVTKLSGVTGRVSGQAAVVCRAGALEREFTELHDVPIWVYDRSAGLKYLSHHLDMDELSRITTLFVAEPPETSLQLDVLLSSFNKLERIYLVHSSVKQDERVMKPAREHFKKVYALLREAATSQLRETELTTQIAHRSHLTPRMVRMILDVFEELRFVHREHGNLLLNPNPSRTELESSQRYQELASLAEVEQHLFADGISQLTEWIQSRMKGAS